MTAGFTGRAWRAAAFGEPAEVLRLVEAGWPAPEAGRALVRVRACGVGLPDQLMVRGSYPLVATPPVAPGQEVCGEVVAVAPGSAFTLGDVVMGLTPFPEGHGGFGEYAYVRESKSLVVPSALSEVEAAGFMLAFRTAHAALVDRVPLAAGQTLAVLGAAGSSGLAAIALGKALDAEVIAIAGSAAKLAFCAEAGADHGIDYHLGDLGAELRRATGGRGVDVLFDPVGGPVAAAALDGLASRARVALIGFASGAWLDVRPADLVRRNYSAVGVFTGGFTEAEDVATNRWLGELAVGGAIRTPIGATHGFEEVADVLQGLGSDAAPGKIVITV